MCGICGWLNTKKKLDFVVLERMNNIASYRGPDDEGYISVSQNAVLHFKGKDSCTDQLDLLENAGGDNPFLAFGHRRLSILDLSIAGHQPMQSDDGMLCITYNGEIYNYLEIREELLKIGYVFHTNCDTEVLLKAYQEWGESCVLHFNGMWAFAIWDKNEKKIFCSRDRLGVKPFYYYVDNNNFIFSSEIKQLCQNPIIPRIMNDKILVTQITWGLTDFSDETLIRDIKTLRGGFNLNVFVDDSNGQLRINRIDVKQYWDIDTHKKKEPSVLNSIFKIHENAVAIRTRSDVPIGILLSGGLDSSSLVAEVSEYYRRIGNNSQQINTFTSCYMDFPEGDEREYAKMTNQYCDAHENLIYPDETDTFSLYKDMVWHVEGQYGINALGAFMMLREISKSGIKVMLNGQGSDETMFGYERYYGWYLKDIYSEKGMGAFLQALNKISSNSRLSKKELLAYMIYFNCYFVRKLRNIKRINRVASRYTVSEAKKNNEVKKNVSFSSLADLQYNEIRGTQLTHILRGDDRMYMAFSMESRVPFIDYRYIEKAIQLPEEDKIVDGYTKYPLRKHMEGHLPDAVVWRRNKMGWPSPRKRWIDRFNKNEVGKLFVNSRSRKYFDIEKVKNLYIKNPYAFGVEQYINTEVFMRLFDVESV